ncbi:MAG: DNA cytosine methyltransferase [bacterium]|nr:DNA cytosine methyltransferase [bacterium]
MRLNKDNYTIPLGFSNELIIDNFAGGGGTSSGLEQAFGRPVDIAINHDPEALAMHAANHPHTKHLCESVWDIDPIKVTNNQPVGLVWLSPDCKHFSKAKGGKPVDKRIRGLAWVTLRWAAKCKPRVIMLENVGEFQTWGPLLIDVNGDAKPDPAKKGKTFGSFIRQLKAHGYDVEHREMRACDYGTPTIRKRFFLIARRDGIKIQWPEPTHGAPDSIEVTSGKLQTYRTAAECIDWSIPCPSIFERNRPLAEATLRRIAKGIMRYVVNAADPFIIGQGGPVYSGKPVTVEQPFGTLTTENHRSVVVPTLVQTGYGERKAGWYCKHCSTQFGIEPTCGCTACGNEDDLIPVKAQSPRSLDIKEPLGTVVGGGVKHALAATFLSPYYSDKRPNDARGQIPNEPINTVPTENRHALVTALLTEHANASNQRVMPVDEPLRTICAQVKGGHFSLVSAHITKFRTGAIGSAMTEPLHTITAGPKENPAGCPHAMGIVTAHIQRDMGQSVGHAIDGPLGTTTAGGGGHSAIVTSNLVKLRGTSNAAATNDPLGTISAGGLHHAEVRAFLLSYYGTDQAPKIDGPLATVTSKERFGLVTIKGQDYQIVDIGLRMLSPRELFRAQGFKEDYIFTHIPDPAILFMDGVQIDAEVLGLPMIPLTKSAQVRMCGNSVCPPMAFALIQASFKHEKQIARAA